MHVNTLCACTSVTAHLSTLDKGGSHFPKKIPLEYHLSWCLMLASSAVMTKSGTYSQPSPCPSTRLVHEQQSCTHRTWSSCVLFRVLSSHLLLWTVLCSPTKQVDHMTHASSELSSPGPHPHEDGKGEVFTSHQHAMHSSSQRVPSRHTAEHSAKRDIRYCQHPQVRHDL